MEIYLTANEAIHIEDLNFKTASATKLPILLNRIYELRDLKYSSDLQHAIDTDKIVLKRYNETIIPTIRYPGLNTDLKISDLLKSKPDMDYKDFDFTLILAAVNSNYEKGRKFERYYSKALDNDDLYVKKTYSDIIGDRIINGITVSDMLLGIEIKIEWYKYNDTLDSDNKIIQSWFTREQAGEYLMKRRRRNINNLRGLVDKTPAEPYVIALFDFYKGLVEDYIEMATDDLKNVMLNETNPDILNILNLSFYSTLLDREETLGNIIISQL